MLLRLRAAALVLIVVSTPAFGVTYQVTDLGPLHYANSIVSAVNSSGMVAGSIYDDTTQIGRGWVYANGQTTYVAPPVGMTGTSIFGISDTGVAVGGFYNSQEQHAFTWTSLGGLSPLFPNEPVQNSSSAMGISDDGTSIAGHGFAPYPLFNYSFLLKNQTTYTNHGIDPAWRRLGVSNSGEVVGISERFDSDAALYWKPTADPAFLEFPFAQQPDFSYAEAISNNGVIVGKYQPDRETHAFIIKTDGTGFISLGALPGDTDSQGHDINDFGTVVGFSGVWFNGSRAFVWTPTAGMTDLNTLIDPASGWQLAEANALNDYGLIAGAGYINGERRAFLLTPVPEPASFSVLAAAILPLLFRRGSSRGAKLFNKTCGESSGRR